MKTTVNFLGLTVDGFAICEVENSFAVAYVEYDVIDMSVVSELNIEDKPYLIETYNPLSIMDIEVIIEWFYSVLN